MKRNNLLALLLSRKHDADFCKRDLFTEDCFHAFHIMVFNEQHRFPDRLLMVGGNKLIEIQSDAAFKHIRNMQKEDRAQ